VYIRKIGTFSNIIRGCQIRTLKIMNFDVRMTTLGWGWKDRFFTLKCTVSKKFSISKPWQSSITSQISSFSTPHERAMSRPEITSRLSRDFYCPFLSHITLEVHLSRCSLPLSSRCTLAPTLPFRHVTVFLDPLNFFWSAGSGIAFRQFSKLEMMAFHALRFEAHGTVRK